MSALSKPPTHRNARPLLVRYTGWLRRGNLGVRLCKGIVTFLLGMVFGLVGVVIEIVRFEFVAFHYQSVVHGVVLLELLFAVLLISLGALTIKRCSSEMFGLRKRM